MTLKGVTEYLTIIRLRLGECFLIISETDPRVLVNNIYRYIYIFIESKADNCFSIIVQVLSNSVLKNRFVFKTILLKLLGLLVSR